MSTIRLYLKLIFLITLIFLALSLTARAFGSTHPSSLNPALNGFVEGCKDEDRPCWYGIIPGTTTLEEALNVMAKMGYPPDSAERWETDMIFRDVGEPRMTIDFYNIYYPDRKINVVTFIYLRDLGNLQLIDVLAFFNTPPEITLTAHPDDYIDFPPYISITLNGHYDTRLSQNLSEIAMTNYYPPGGGVEWKGRLRRDIYCQIQMENTGIACK
ncbi:MAG: hypothetical protein H0X30_38125 [Anaerolineae bacterium]|nr:hypothetical protein [Anaerolineae bacterium]